MSKTIASIAPEALVAMVAFTSFLLSEAAGVAEGIPTAVSMGTVVLALLGMEGYRQRQGAEREKSLMARVSKLEDTAQEKLLALIERQLQAATKQDAMMLQLSDALTKLTEGQQGMHAIIARFSQERPCLLKTEHHNLHHPETR